MAKKKLTISHKLIITLLVVSIVWVSASYVLAALGKEALQELSSTVVSVLIIGLVAYFIKSFGEKNSRNKYGIDENGIPYEYEHEECEEENENESELETEINQ